MRVGDRVKVYVQQGNSYTFYIGNLKQILGDIVLTDAICGMGGEETYKEVQLSNRFVISVAVLEA